MSNPTTVEKYQRLKQNAEAAQREADQAEGAFKNQVKQLKDDFGFNTYAEAKEALRGMETELSKLEETLAAKIAAFEKEFPDVATRR